MFLISISPQSRYKHLFGFKLYEAVETSLQTTNYIPRGGRQLAESERKRDERDDKQDEDKIVLERIWQEGWEGSVPKDR